MVYEHIHFGNKIIFKHVKWIKDVIYVVFIYCMHTKRFFNIQKQEYLLSLS